MPKRSREELIIHYKELGLYDENCARFYELPDSQKLDPDIFENFCKSKGGYAAILLSNDEICDNKELVLIAKKYGYYGDFHLLSKRLLADSDIALALADCNRYEYANVSIELRNNLELMKKAISINPNIYVSLPANLKGNRDVVLEVAKKRGNLIERILDIRKELRDNIFSDKEIALALSETNPWFLFNYFNEDVTNDPEILEASFHLSDLKKMKSVLKKNIWALSYIDSSYYINDARFLESALRIDGSVYFNLSEEQKNNRRYVELALKSTPQLYENLPEKFRDDKELLVLALQEDTDELLSFASERLRDDYYIVMLAVKVDALNLQYASPRLRDDKDIVKQAIKTYGGVLEDASERLQQDDELIKIANIHI